ncbi:MAG: Eco57I restriction-modification methylase domain-containing protein [Ruminococcus sp.]|nr:Eco57I restriction-modification methylase domain-containing protein [Ruminococcus sp.]
MKFDFVIGNPPYQDNTLGENETYAPPVYDKFMDEAYKVGDRVELITPARFLFNAGSTPKAWNRKMLNDEHLKVLYYKQNSSNVFSNTDIKGGVAITYHDNTKKFGKIEIFTHFTELNSVMKKVKNNSGFKTLSDIVITRTAYRLTDKMHQDNPNAENQLSKGHRYDMSTNIFERLPQIFFDKKPKDNNEYIQILGREKNKRVYKFVRREYINNVCNLDKYKIILPKSNGSGAIGEVLSTPLIGTPLIGTTESFISIGIFDTEIEAQNALKYIKGKFSRAMLGILKITQDNPPDRWYYVPLQDFTSDSDIDWSVSVAEIDKQLYKKYDLSPEEIEFIETHVKEMV